MAEPVVPVSFIGFGEAGIAFASGQATPARAYDRKADGDMAAKASDYARAGVAGCPTNRAAIAGAALILSVVTADQALAAARETAGAIGPGALYCDMNSVAPQTKRAAAVAIDGVGGRYVDVAVMAPVHPQGRAVPLLVSGDHAADAAAALGALGFSAVRVLAGPVGAASAVKMIRSVMVKGLEALSAECALAAYAAGVEEEVIGSLDASWPGADWRRRFDYNLDRMLVHGSRRAAEMEEVARTLDGIGASAAMTRGAIGWQRALGARGGVAPAGLGAKVALIGVGAARAA